MPIFWPLNTGGKVFTADDTVYGHDFKAEAARYAAKTIADGAQPEAAQARKVRWRQKRTIQLARHSGASMTMDQNHRELPWLSGLANLWVPPSYHGFLDQKQLHRHSAFRRTAGDVDAMAEQRRSAKNCRASGGGAISTLSRLTAKSRRQRYEADAQLPRPCRAAVWVCRVEGPSAKRRIQSVPAR